MADLRTDFDDTPERRDAWIHDNERGLALAADADWGEAMEAFAAAADGLARTLPSNASSHEPLALVLSNLAQACFRAGRVDDAVQHAQRACALRVALAGEDGMPVARTRMDLAVMLASTGRLDEAMALVQRAIAVIEHRVGEEDARLAIVLENAARIALAAGAPANAEPLLIRLHALLDAHDLSTARAEELLSRIAAVRAQQLVMAGDNVANETVDVEASESVEAEVNEAADLEEEPQHVAFVEPASVEPQVYVHASIGELEEWEDQPLRDAVAVTDVLLRTTPSGVPAIPDASAALADIEITDRVEHTETIEFSDHIELSDAFETAEATPDEFSLDLADDFEMELAPLDTPATVATPTPAPPPTPGTGLMLDFAVEHGVIVSDLHEDMVMQGPPISSPIPDALPVMAPGAIDAPMATAPVTQIVSSGPTTGIKPISDIVSTAPPTAQAPTSTSRATTPSPVIVPSKRTAEPAAGGSKLPLIIGAVVVVAGAAAFFLLR